MNKIRIEDLSVGDWVCANGINRRIKSINAVSDVIGFYNTPNYYAMGVIKPIPITPEILEKNGFATRDERYYTFNADEARVDIEKMEDGYEIATFRVLPTGGIITKMICPISSVHQLQHALRLAGNEKEIEL